MASISYAFECHPIFFATTNLCKHEGSLGLVIWMMIKLTSKKDLSSHFLGGPGAGAACVTVITSARSETKNY